MAQLHFLGATRTVTGSKHLLAVVGYRVTVDCVLFQGLKELRLRNWEPLPLDPSSINAVILTHAHIDHTGFLPKRVRDGFDGVVYCTPATVDLSRILLPDSGRLQEEEAAYANKVGSTRHRPALDRKSTRLNSSHLGISYAVFCLKKKKQKQDYV